MALYLGKTPISNVDVSFKHINNEETTYDATLSSGSQMLEGITAYSKGEKYTGTIPSQPAKTITPNNNSQIAISAGTYAEGSVTISAVPTETKNITVNGTYVPTDGKYFSSVNVNIAENSFNTQTKSVSPTESAQTVIPDDGYDGLSSVAVSAISSNYVGSGVARKEGITITPTTSAQTVVNAGTYVTGDIIVEASSSSGGIDTSDATATANDIAAGKTAYANGNKIEGTMVVKEYYVSIAQPSASLGNDGDLCLVRGE